MRHALITGGAGFIGSHLVDSLLNSSWRVTVIDNFDPFYSPELKRRNVAPHISNPRYTLIERDINDILQFRCDLQATPDVIVHLAAKAGVRPSISDPLAYHEANVTGTQSILEYARIAGVRQFVFASSSSVYGANPNVPWSEDDHMLMPISPYASTKLSGEFLGHVYSHLFGVRFIGLRFFTVYGPRQRPDLAISRMTRLILDGLPVPMYGDGTTRRDYTYVADIVKGIRGAMDYERSMYEIINLGNDCPVTLSEMIRTIESALGVRAQIQRLPEQAGDVPQTWARIDKAQRLLEYRPAVQFPDGVLRFTESLQALQRVLASAQRADKKVLSFVGGASD